MHGNTPTETMFRNEKIFCVRRAPDRRARRIARPSIRPALPAFPLRRRRPRQWQRRES
jgi:hypothetical protein